MLTVYYVHDVLSRTVKVFYNLDDAERNTTQYCYVQQIDLLPAASKAMSAYRKSVDKYEPLYKLLA